MGPHDAKKRQCLGCLQFGARAVGSNSCGFALFLASIFEILFPATFVCTFVDYFILSFCYIVENTIPSLNKLTINLKYLISL